MTNQTIMDKQLATKGWLAYPKTNRLVMFDAQYLHGVIPGKGLNPFPQRPLPDNNASVFQECSNTRRLTFMVGFWDKISATPRGTDCPGPGQPFPIVEDTKYTWPAEMAIDSSIQYNLDKTLTPVEPQQIPKVWENMTASMASQAPSYQECFQGF